MARSIQPAQHRSHQQVAGAERTAEPVGVGKPTGKFAQPLMDAILEDTPALLPLDLAAPLARGGSVLNDRQIHRAQRVKHPQDRARPGIGILRQQARVVLRDMENDRPGLKQDCADSSASPPHAMCAVLIFDPSGWKAR